MREVTVRVHEIATDGLPDMSARTGRVAFIFDGCIVSGWPLDGAGVDAWGSDCVSYGRPTMMSGIIALGLG